MRRFLLLFPLILGLTTVNAQYTITDQNGEAIADGSTTYYEISSPNANHEVHWHLHSVTSDDIVFQVTGTTQPGPPAENLACVVHCYAPNDQNPHTEPLDANNEAELALYYRPKGTTGPAVIDYTIHKVDDESVSISFSISYTILTDINELEAKETFFAFPNPANNNVRIEYNTKESAEVVIYNIIGEKVKQFDLNAGSQKIDINTTDLASGTYFYSLISDSKAIETKRLVIKH